MTGVPLARVALLWLAALCRRAARARGEVRDGRRASGAARRSSLCPCSPSRTCSSRAARACRRPRNSRERIARVVAPRGLTRCRRSRRRSRRSSRTFRIRPACTCGRPRTARCSTSARRSACGRASAATGPTRGTARRREMLMALVADLETIVVPSETQALLLEYNLIKEHRPRFNILLRDDKSYPYVKVTVQEPYPRVFVTRRLLNDGARYFGPYTDVGAMRRALESREAHLHGALVQLGHAGPDARARVPRLLHQAVQGPVHLRAVARGLPRDDRGGARLSRRAHRGGGAARARAHGTRRRRRWTTSAPPSCATRSGTCSRWRSRPSSSRSGAANATWSGTRATARMPA